MKEQELCWGMHFCNASMFKTITQIEMYGKTVQLVPTAIHDACCHSGGVSEQKYRSAMGDICLDDKTN